MKKKIRVLTDDPKTPTAMLTIQGPVEKVVDIQPRSLVFQGDRTKVTPQILTLIPTEKYPLNILEVTLKNGKFLTTQLETTEIKGKKAFKVVVQTKKEATGNFYDKLMIKTDSKIKPMITVWVKGRLQEKPATLPAKE